MNSKHSRSRLVTGLLAGLLVCAVGVGGTVAWLHDSAKVTNTFDMAKVEGSISEPSFIPDESTVKPTIEVYNNGDIDAYVRVALSACWMDGEGNIAPLNAELDVTDSQEEWFKQGGYYYYKGKVSPGNKATWDLNAQPTANNAAEAEPGWQFRVDVSAQLIQADPPEAVEHSWNVTVTADGNLSKTP